MNNIVLIQGEKASISGTVTSSGSAYSLLGKKIVAIIKCLDNGFELVLDNFTGTTPRISISGTGNNIYSFALASDETVKMAGKCTMEIAVVTSEGPILPVGAPISLSFAPSYIGEYISKNGITANQITE